MNSVTSQMLLDWMAQIMIVKRLVFSGVVRLKRICPLLPRRSTLSYFCGVELWHNNGLTHSGFTPCVCAYCNGSMAWPRTQTYFHYITGCTQEGRSRLELEPGWRGVGRHKCRSQDDDLITSCLQPAVTQQPQRHPCWSGRGGSTEDRQTPPSLSGGRAERQARAQIWFRRKERRREGSVG